MMEDQYQDIDYEVAEGRARITSPDLKPIMLFQKMLEELEHALWRADEDQSVRNS